MQEIVFTDAAQLVIDRLNERFADLDDPSRAFRSIPADRPGRFVTVRRTGGVKVTLVSEIVQLTVEAWDVDAGAAQDLAQLARSIISAMAHGRWGGVPFGRYEEFSGPADLPDPDREQARFTWTCTLHVRAASIA